MSAEVTGLINPGAGRGKGARAALSAARVPRDAGFLVRAVVGEDAADAPRRVRSAVDRGTGAVVAVGGDGLGSLALGAVAGTGTPLAIVAAGTGNDTARGSTTRPAAVGRPPATRASPRR